MSSRYFSLNDYFKKRFNEKIYKVTIDAGFDCPNRDGSISTGGCVFCSETGSGEFAGNRESSIIQQIDDQIEFIKKKFPHGKVIAYFQNFTNTYGSISYLRKIYYEALSHPRVAGIAIATRPDCLDEEVLDLLEEIGKKNFLWIELGLQSSNDETARRINRGYLTEKYLEVSKKLKERNIPFVTHIIVGLPWEKIQDSLNTALFAVNCGTWGIKIHSLYVMKNSRLEEIFKKNSFTSILKEEYIDAVVNILERLPESIVIHRLTGDCKKSLLCEPMWSANKIDVLNSIEKELKYRNSWQGKEYLGGIENEHFN